MLSEHETLELLEQLKLGVLPGAAGFGELEVDAVGHWPVLIGGGMCLNLQTVAALELNCQPDCITVIPTQVRMISCADLSSRYQEVHHLSTGTDGRTLIIAYDQKFSSMLSLLQETDYHSTRENSVLVGGAPEPRSDSSSLQYEFSQAIATSIDPDPPISGRPVGLSFLALDDEELVVAGSWRIQLGHKGVESEFFVGLVNSNFDSAITEPVEAAETFSISVRPEKICRTVGDNTLVAELAAPEVLQFARMQVYGSSPVGKSVNQNTGIDRGADEQQECTQIALLVQRMLQLSVDDLYLLLIEAVGGANVVTFRFEITPLSILDSGQLLREGCNHRCLSVNGLPVRCAYLAVDDGKFLIKSQE